MASCQLKIPFGYGVLNLLLDLLLYRSYTLSEVLHYVDEKIFLGMHVA